MKFLESVDSPSQGTIINTICNEKLKGEPIIHRYMYENLHNYRHLLLHPQFSNKHVQTRQAKKEISCKRFKGENYKSVASASLGDPHGKFFGGIFLLTLSGNSQ